MTADPPSTEAALSLGTISFRLAMVLLLVALNAFFVAAEFALVAVRRSRIDELAARGDRSAAVVQRALTDLDRYISATQLGITLASLGLGWIGEPALAQLVDSVLAAVGLPHAPAVTHSAAAVAIAFLIITFLHIVLGELAPKSVALLRAEAVSRWVARPLMWFSQLMSPFIVLLNGTANRLLRLFGVEPASEGSHVHSPEELRLLVMQARAHGTLDESDSAMLAGVFDFHNKKAYDVMRPRTDVVAISEDATADDVRETLRNERYSRYPVYRESLDDIVGVLLAKDFWLYEGEAPFDLASHMREPLMVPATRAAERVLEDLRRTRAHLAVVLDEYGGTAGIVTLEDLVEEVVGDIADEYDLVAREAMVTDGMLELAGSLSLVDVRSDYQIAIPEGDWTTLGGYTFGTLGRLPRIGDRVGFPGGELEVVAMDGKRVAAVRVHGRRRARTETTARVPHDGMITNGKTGGPPSTGRTGRAQASVLAVVTLAVLGAGLVTACGTKDGGTPSDAAAVAAATLDALEPLAPPGAPADSFPSPARAVADIVAPRWSGEDERDDAGEAARVIELLGVRAGMKIADIGAGDGYYVARLSPLVGATGRVYAEDIVPRYQRDLLERIAENGWTNVTVVPGDAHDPRLPPASLDAAILVHMYHEIEQPFGLLWNLATALRPGGHVAILDLERPTWGHGTPLALLRCELAAVGYRELRADRSVPGEYLVLFEAPSDSLRPTPAMIRARLDSAPCTP